MTAPANPPTDAAAVNPSDGATTLNPERPVPRAAGYIPPSADDPNAPPRIVTSRFDIADAHTLAGYEATGGYQALRAALALTPEQVHEEVRAATLLGRGGAGFPAGIKWGFCPPDVWPRYLVVNGDESEPGTYKDRLLMELDPHQLIEGCLIACYAVGLSQCFLYIRGEMALAQERVCQALNEAYAAGYIGRNILGSDLSVDIIQHSGAGAYVVGEETALIESLEGNRGMPRQKPPYFPAAIGLYNKPTIVNNVETLANLPWIINNGAAAYTAIGTESSPGTRMVAVSGQVQRPGVYEITNGTTTFRDLLFGEHYCQGTLPGRELRAFVPGGGSAPWFTPAQLDLPYEASAVGPEGSMLGSGAVIAMDDTADVVAMALTLTKFYAHESCGKCTPCREGATWLERILRRIVDGNGTPRDLKLLTEVGQTISPGENFPHAAVPDKGIAAHPFPYAMSTICFLGPSAYVPVHSALTLFPEEFEARVAPNAHLDAELVDRGVSQPGGQPGSWSASQPGGQPGSWSASQPGGQPVPVEITAPVGVAPR